MKKLLLSTQLFLFIAFNFFLLMAGYQLLSSSNSMVRMNYKKPVYNTAEEFDPSLGRLNSIKKLIDYCDSQYNATVKGNTSLSSIASYSEMASAVIQKRFYHGYSMYGFNKNFVAMFLSEVSVSGLSAIVVPEDILKYPYAACSQQSIVLMELLSQKGYSTRKVGFKGNKYGHFCFEVYYDGGWHFFDPDMEPRINVLNTYKRPSIEFLATNKDVLLKAYSHYSTAMVLDIFPNYFYGPVNTFPAPKAILFQKASNFLSYTLWSFFLVAFIWVRRKYKRLCNPVAVKKATNGFVIHTPVPVSSVYSPA